MGELKVCQSYEVVEILDECGYQDAFVVGRTSFICKDEIICNSDSYRNIHKNGQFGILNPISRLYVPKKSYKKIGKLTITKLK